MYTRSHGRFPRGMRVPENYSGNAFRPYPVDSEPETPPQESPPPAEAQEQEPPREEEPQREAAPVGTSRPYFRFSPAKLFSRFTGGGIGFEELLLLGLVLLLSEEGENDDLILLLILLLFIS